MQTYRHATCVHAEILTARRGDALHRTAHHLSHTILKATISMLQPFPFKKHLRMLLLEGDEPGCPSLPPALCVLPAFIHLCGCLQLSGVKLGQGPAAPPEWSWSVHWDRLGRGKQ